MKFLKWFGLTVIGILLFLSLSVFGIALTVKSTVANPGFITKEIEKVPVSVLVNETLDTNTDTSGQDLDLNLTPEVKAAIEQAVADLEPQLKQETSLAVTREYDYLLGKKDSPDMAATLRNTVLSDEFINAVIDKLPVADVVSSIISEQLKTQDISMAGLLLADQIPTAIAQSEPLLKADLKTAAPQTIDYIMGITASLNTSIDLKPVIDNLRAYARNLLLNPPPALAAALGPALPVVTANPDAYIDTYFAPVLLNIGDSIIIDESTYGDARASITDGISNAEDAMAQAKPYVAMFNTYYILLILLILVLIGGIIAIHHSVKGATRSLGSIFLSYGIVEFAGMILARFFFKTAAIPRIQSQDFGNGRPVPTELIAFVQQVFHDITTPLFYFSLGVLIAGVVLLVVSFVYRSGRRNVETVK